MLALAPARAYAIDGEETMPAAQGGGKISFTGAASKSWITNPDGTRDLLLKFTADQPGTFVLPGASKTQILMIGGGGGGGGSYRYGFTSPYGGGAGGGAGGFLEFSEMLSGASYSVSVGEGGQGTMNGTSATSERTGGDGGDTTILKDGASWKTAYGGGGGGGLSAGNPGGSGGGGSQKRNPSATSQGIPQGGGAPKDETQGFKGGEGDAALFGGGGGGAGGAGADASTSNPTGGVGRASGITKPNGTPESAWPWYAGGGGGGWGDKNKTSATEGIKGGKGGGGQGGVGRNTGIEATPGDPETGGGGGGGNANNVTSPGGANGGSGVVYVRISLSIAGSVKRPEMTDLVYTGAEQTLIVASAAYSITLPDGTELPGDYVGTDVATYKAKVSLRFAGLEWDGGGSEDIDFSRRIVKAQVVISDLYQKSWMYGMPEDDTPKPTCTVTPPFPDAVPVYTYGDSESGPFGPDKPTEIGEHWVRAEVFGTPNYDGAVAIASFKIINGLGALFYDYVQIDIGKYQGADAPLTNFPYRIELSEASPVGFLYERAGKTGDDLAITDADGNPYPYWVDWKVGGTSALYVRLDELGSAPQSLVLYWKLRPGKSAPDHDPDAVWSDWTKAQADSKTGIPAYVFDLVVRDGKWRVNYFTRKPSITKDEWELPERPAEGDIDDGELKEGSILRTITDVNGRVILGIPSAGGTYRITVTADDPDGIYLKPLEEHKDFRIIEHPTFDDLHGGEESLTAAGRVLLMNDDGAGVHEVTDQSYYQTDPTRYPVFWVHKSPEGEHKADWANLKRFPGTYHELCRLNDDGSTNVLWTFENILIGNNYDPDLDWRYGNSNCRLPYSPTAKPISDPSLDPGLPAEAGNIVMRNMVGAIVTSPLYTNGVGTIYFDALNSIKAESEVDDQYRIVVEATGTNENWKACQMLVLKRDGDDTAFEDPFETDSLPLRILTQGEGRFYRVCVKLNRREPVRFRIRRVTSVPTISCGIDQASFILLDNIIVSYPALEAGVKPYGRYEKEFSGPYVLGQEAAMIPPFPSAPGDLIYARANPYALSSPATNVDARTLIQVTEMHYRWRYEGQITNREETVKIWPTAGYVSDDPLVLTNDAGRALGEGDVDFWFVSKLDMPSYAYHDYSGAGAGLTNAAGRVLYTEAINERTDWMAKTAAGEIPWFFRLRQGKSDWERFRAYVKTAADAAEEMYEGVLAGDRIWNILVPTPSAVEGGLYVRFEGVNRQTPGAEEWSENASAYQIVAEGSSIITPWATGFVKPGTDWVRVKCDAATGYLMFRVDDGALSYSVVHADKQDFNFWNDANKTDGKGLFVGTSTDTNSPGMSGSSSLTREFRADLDYWHLSVATNPTFWTENFRYGSGAWDPHEMDEGGAWEAYKSFASKKTPHGWTAGPGQWTAGYYRDYTPEGVGMALQMQGQGKGYLQFVNSAEAPRGLESISLRARVSQMIRFGDISYYDAGKKEAQKMTDYTFYTRAAFDLANRTDFSGNASLSLVAFMTSDGGCYEFRVEQYGAFVSSAGDVSPDNRFRLSLHRWSYEAASNELVPEELGWTVIDYASASTKPLTTNGSNGSYGGLFLSVKNDAGKTYLVAGLSRSNSTKSTGPGSDFDYVYCIDDNAKRLTYGTYGAMCANCPGTFVCPAYYNKSVTCPSDATTTMKKVSGGSASRSISGTRTSCYDDMNSGYWTAGRGRMTVYASGTADYGLKHIAPETQLYLYKAKAGSTDWEKEAFYTNTLTSFKSSDAITIPLWTKDDCSVKIAAGGSDDTSRIDITVDDVELRQWRGEDYNENGWSRRFPVSDVSYALPSNFVFTQAWMLEGEAADGSVRTNCQLNAKRSLTSKPLSIRSPLYDGLSGRGLGLGMISFTYENATENVNLLVQIATNRDINLGSLATATMQGTNSAYWVTVTNFSFRGATDLARGTRSQYLGLHGITGAMRIIMDPEVIRSAEGTDDESEFGSIDITSVVCRDEPKLDQASWWGWNIRTTDEIARRNLWDNDYIDDNRHGLSFALNNSVYDGIRIGDPVNPERMYPEHLPFLQTPTFQGENVGEISFKARRYDAGGADARVTLYGAKAATVAAEDDTKWTALASWIVSNDTFEVQTYRTRSGDDYMAFRLAVTGVGGVKRPTMPEDRFPTDPCVRVLIDDVLVTEAIRASVRFRNVGAFRNGLDTLLTLTNVTDRSQQPLVGEAWGVQGEIFASQYGGEIDLSTAKVRLWWYENLNPWGFDNWRSNVNARSVWLSRCADSNTVFRSSYLGTQGSVMKPQTKATTVQYMLEVVYRDEDGGEATATLVHGTQFDWEKPRWYDPLDYNAGKSSWSAYTILDTVAPGWAWINEVNIFGTWGNGWDNSDVPLQFLEIAAPGDADLTGWKIRFLDALRGSDRIVTNEVATFGDNIPGKKDAKWFDRDSKFAFHVLGSQIVADRKTLDPNDGRFDGIWRRTSSDGKQMQATGEVAGYYPLSIQLVRPTGIVEHEVTSIGTNHYPDVNYQPQTHVDYLNAHEPGGGHFVYVGADDRGGESEFGWSRSLGVHRGNGGIGIALAEDITNYWNNVHTMTPGRLNGGQIIDPDCPHPQGDSIVIYSYLDGPHLRQTFGNAENTNATATLVFRKGDPNGTNILYAADRWYALGEVTQDGRKVTPRSVGLRTWSLELGRYASNDITVVAGEAIDPTLVERYGLGPDNRYRDAVMDWLTKGVDAAGRRWHDPETETLGLADYVGADASAVVTNLDLTAMYWLDIDPTWADHVMRYQAYFSQPPIPFDAGGGLTNVTLKVFMKIFNTTTGEAWAPYVLRSADIGKTSWDYAGPRSGTQWGDVSFKVTGILVNGPVVSGNFARKNWLPLRWFVFSGGESGGVPYSTSFGYGGNPYEALIEIVDPYSTASPGYTVGWHDWVKEHGWCPVFWAWDIDDRARPESIEILRPDSTLTE